MLIMVSLVLCAASAPSPPKMRRVCQDHANNTIYFLPTDDTCTGFLKYYIWGRAGSGPFQTIDSINIQSTDQYTHVNANPGTPKLWQYFIVYTNSCDSNPAYSDTLAVDELAPDTVILDSVSVDITTNHVVFGWHWNKSPDFSHYTLYRDSSGIWIHLVESTRDTSYIDLRPSSDPKLGSLTYDINSYDSCGNPVVFGFASHSTIYLSGFADTCKAEASLLWTPYRGWDKIRSYYIFKKENSGEYILIDSVPSTQLSYKDPITLGFSNQYFIRSFRDSSIIFTSTSSGLTLQTRARKDPVNTSITNVSAIDPDNSLIELSIKIFNGEECKEITPFYSIAPDPGLFHPTQPLDVLNFNGEKSIQFTASRDKIQWFKVGSTDLCGNLTGFTPVSADIVLKVSPVGASNKLAWNSYFGWSAPPEKYVVYRGTDLGSGMVYEKLAELGAFDTVFSDDVIPEKVGNTGLCYYVEAAQPSSIGSKTSKSFSSCILGTTLSFVPNAFNPFGVNTHFRPEGSFIDYVNSSLEIYDRWGGLIIQKKDISEGWDGKDASSAYCPQGAYYYKLNLKGFDGSQKNYAGFVTLLN